MLAPQSPSMLVYIFTGWLISEKNEQKDLSDIFINLEGWHCGEKGSPFLVWFILQQI